MFCRLALPKIRTLTADDEVMLCSWQRVQAPPLIYLTCNVIFTVDNAAFAGAGIQSNRRRPTHYTQAGIDSLIKST